MALSGWKSFGSALPSADDPGAVHLYQALASARQWAAEECKPRFTHLFHNEAADPTTGPKSSSSPPFQRPLLAAIDWRCLPFLWRFTPTASLLTIRICGDVESSTIQLQAQFYPGSIPANATAQTVGTDKIIEFTLRVPRAFRGVTRPVLLYYRSSYDLAAVADTGHSYIGDDYWYTPIPSTRTASTLGHIRNASYPPAGGAGTAPVAGTDDLAWSAGTRDWLPAQVLCYKSLGGTALTAPRQIIQIDQGAAAPGGGGVAVILNPPLINYATQGVYGGWFLWDTYDIGALRISSITVIES
jgi:hypothetical protein